MGANLTVFADFGGRMLVRVYTVGKGIQIKESYIEGGRGVKFTGLGRVPYDVEFTWLQIQLTMVRT